MQQLDARSGPVERGQLAGAAEDVRQADENIGALAIELTPDDLRDIDSAAAKITVLGARYPERLEQMTGR